MKRIVEPELLDHLAPDDPSAVTSRKDLKRVNRLMRHAEIIAQSLLHAAANFEGGRIVELGAGDGTLLLSVAQRVSQHWPRAHVILVDQQSLVGKETQDAFQGLGWEVEVVKADVFDWLGFGTSARSEAILTNLFLHHFSDQQVSELMHHAAEKTKLFIACEPRRTLLPWTVSHSLGLIGCNAVTRHDAVISVRAGFTGNELSTLWPSGVKWSLRERAAGLFSHVFVAARKE